jgi:glycine/D-amino acid oxidase-like deaminating enzyme
VSYWDARTPRARRPSWPRHRGHVDTDVAIIGGGLAGCATAYVFAASGINVALFEEGTLAGGATASSSGLLLQSPDTPFGELAGLHGVKTARHIWQATRRASLDLAATLRRLGIRADLALGASLKLARTDDEARRLRREMNARRDAGLEAVWVNARRLQTEAALEGAGAILSREDGLVDPVRTTLGLARAAAARGARLFERSAVGRVKPARRWIDLRTDGGTVRASAAVVATGGPSDGFGSLERHFRRIHTYQVVTEPLSAAVRRETGRLHAIVRDSDVPPHHLAWLRDNRVLFAGAGQPALAERARPRALTQRTGQLMYELSRLYPAISGLLPAFGWDAAYARTADGIAFIGPHRNFPRHLFALGCPPGGLAQAFLAARILLRAHSGTPDAGDQVFAFTRLIA